MESVQKLLALARKLVHDYDTRALVHEFKVTVILLLCSSAVGWLVHNLPFSTEFRKHFEMAHEFGTLATWGVFVVRALLRSVLKPLRHK